MMHIFTLKKDRIDRPLDCLGMSVVIDHVTRGRVLDVKDDNFNIHLYVSLPIKVNPAEYIIKIFPSHLQLMKVEKCWSPFMISGNGEYMPE